MYSMEPSGNRPQSNHDLTRSLARRVAHELGVGALAEAEYPLCAQTRVAEGVGFEPTVRLSRDNLMFS